MRRIAWGLLILFVFAIPWEYSLDVGAPFGNAARILGVMTLLAAVPAVLQEARFRRVSALHWLTIAFFVWQCCTLFWTKVPDQTLYRLRLYAQEMMLLWLIWEFVGVMHDLQVLLRAWLAGSGVLVILTIAGFASAVRLAVEQVRFAAVGQDPNDVARLLAFGFPVAALVAQNAYSRVERTLALLYFPAACAAVLLTASRSGLLLGAVALLACGVAGVLSQGRVVLIVACGVIVAGCAIFAVAPPGTLDRLRTAAKAQEYGDLNQRVNIWAAGWRAFESAPMIGHGAGSFVSAAKLAPEDTAHNTALALLVEGGVCSLVLATAIVGFAVAAIKRAEVRLRFGLWMLMALWVVSSLTGTLWENRTTWLLIGVAAASGRIAAACRAGVFDADEPVVPNREREAAATTR